MLYSVFSLTLVAYLLNVDAWPAFPAFVPNGNAVPDVVAIGHTSGRGGGLINQFGQDFRSVNFIWTEALCEMDSDGDGASNGLELGDPCCTWAKAQPGRLREMDISNPGDASSVTSAIMPDCTAGGAGVEPSGKAGAQGEEQEEVEVIFDPNVCTTSHPKYDYVRNECVGDSVLGEGCEQHMDCESSFCFQGQCRQEAPARLHKKSVVVDDFYGNAMEVRHNVLTLGSFVESDKFPYLHTPEPWFNRGTWMAIQERLGYSITPSIESGTFLISTESSPDAGVTWSRDEYAAVLYLTPQSIAPLTAGTQFLCHRELQLCTFPSEKDAARLGQSLSSLTALLERDRFVDDAWEPVDYISSMFNRLTMFRGSRFRKVRSLYGTGASDGNLFQIFSFNVSYA